MATYQTVMNNTWDDPTFQDWSPHAKLVFLNLITSHRHNPIGLYAVSFKAIGFETGLSEEEAVVAFEELQRPTGGYARLQYDTERSLVWVVNALRHQSAVHLKNENVTTHIRALLRQHEGSPLVTAFCHRYKASHPWLFEGAMKGLPSPLQGATCRLGKVRLGKERSAASSFDRFWTGYPRKTKKQDAAVAWRRLAPDPVLVETILAALARHARSDQWTRDGGRFIPHPSTWLHGKRWEDVLDVEPSRRASPLWRGAGRAGASAPAGLRPGAAPDGESVGVQGPADQRGVS